MGHSPECLATFPGMCEGIPRNIWRHSPECLVTFPGMIGDIPRNIAFPPFPAFPAFRFPFLYSWFYTQPSLSHVSFLIFCSHPIKFFLFSNYSMSFNILRPVMKFRNSAVLRLRILPLLRLDYFCKNIHSCSGL